VAHAYAPQRFNTPERAIRFILADRHRRGILAVLLGAVATIATLGMVYVVYRELPAPSNPANNLSIPPFYH
jgi:hypothetical protein